SSGSHDSRGSPLPCTNHAYRQYIGDFSLLLFSGAVLSGLNLIRQDVLDQKEQNRTSPIGCNVTINIENNSVSAWFLKQGFYPDVVGNSELIEICFEEIHFFLLIVETNTLFAGL